MLSAATMMRRCFHKRCCARIFAPAVGVGLRHDRRLRDRVWSRRSSARSDVERSRWSARSNRAAGLSGMSDVWRLVVRGAPRLEHLSHPSGRDLCFECERSRT